MINLINITYKLHIIGTYLVEHFAVYKIKSLEITYYLLGTLKVLTERLFPYPLNDRTSLLEKHKVVGVNNDVKQSFKLKKIYLNGDYSNLFLWNEKN